MFEDEISPEELFNRFFGGGGFGGGPFGTVCPFVKRFIFALSSSLSLSGID